MTEFEYTVANFREYKRLTHAKERVGVPPYGSSQFIDGEIKFQYNLFLRNFRAHDDERSF
ncbi:MAG TPA: hypothetical protein V6D08_06845 [Candidatus Obscuribacterales bacterium]